MINLFYKKKTFYLHTILLGGERVFLCYVGKKPWYLFWIYDNSGEKHLIDNEKRLDEIFVLLKKYKK
jgi:hypothetical protein